MDRFNRVSVYVFLLLVGILYGAWMWSTGPIGDDLWYSRVFENKEGGGFVDSSLSFALSLGNQIETLSDALNSIINHYLYWNNGRLANALMFLSNFVPYWVVDCFHVLFFMLMFIMICEMSCVEWRNNIGYSVLLMWCVWGVLPWGNYMIISDFQMNYVWSTALNLLVLWRLTSSHGNVKYSILWGVIFAIAAMMHEAYSLSMICGIIVWVGINYKLILRDFNAWRPILILALVYVLFSLVPLLSPALFLRLNDSVRTDLLPYYIVHYFVLRYYLLIFVMVVLLWIACKKGGSVAMSFLRENLSLIAIVLAIFVIGVFSLNYSRGLFYGMVIQIVLLFRVLSLLFDFAKLKNIKVIIISILLGCGFLCWLTNVGLIQNKLYKEHVEVASVVSKTKQNIVFKDITTEHDIAWYYFSDILPIAEGFCVRIGGIDGIEKEYVKEKLFLLENPIIVLPQNLEQKAFEKWDTVSGNTHLRGAWPYYFSKEKIDVSGMRVEFKSPLDDSSKKSVHPIYALPDAICDLFGLKNKGNKSIFVSLQKVHCAVPDNLRQNNVLDCDSIWVYAFDNPGLSVRGREVATINL